MTRTATILGAAAAMCSAQPLFADVEVFTTNQRAAWFAAAEAMAPVKTIGFDEGYPSGTLVEFQYSHLGVTFQNTNDRFAGVDFISFPHDGWGLNGNGPTFNDVIIHLDQPHYAVGVDFPGQLDVMIFWQDQQIGFAQLGSSGRDWFGGLISDQPFDKVIFEEPSGNVLIDDLHFAVPGPGAGVLLLPLFLLHRRKCVSSTIAILPGRDGRCWEELAFTNP